MPVRASVTVCLIPEAKGGPFLFWEPMPQSFALAKSLGYEAVEFFPPEPDAFDPQEVQEELTKHGLVVSAVGSGAGWIRHKLSLTDPHPAQRLKAREYIRGMIDFAAALGAPVIIGSMQGRWGGEMSRDQALAFLAEALNDLGNHAGQRGQVLLYEPLNRYETNLLSTVEDGVAFLETLTTTSVKLLADLFHMNIEEANIADALRAGGNHIGHLHFADSNRRPAGLGHMDYAPIAQALRDMNYSGFLAAEAFPYPNPEEAARQTFSAFVEHFR